MTLRNLLRKKKADIVQRWQDDVQACYAPETRAFLNRGKDRFEDPVGHTLRTGTVLILDGLLDGLDAVDICRHLEEIIRVRAVQDMTPSQALSFVFSLKKAARDVLGVAAGGEGVSAEWTAFDDDVDQVALFAFDIYSKCRHQLSELKVNEMKRSVAGIFKRFHGEPVDAESDRNDPCANSNGLNT